MTDGNKAISIQEVVEFIKVSRIALVIHPWNIKRSISGGNFLPKVMLQMMLMITI